MSYVISENDLAVLRRVCNDLEGLIAGRNDVPAQFHADVEDARGVLGNTQSVPEAPPPVAIAAAAVPETGEENN